AEAQSTSGIFSGTGEIATLAFQWALLAVADHGLRPGKAMWWVLGVLAFFMCGFWLFARIIGFEPKSEEAATPAPEGSTAPPVVWPVSILFLFDRLIPVYRIREEHYAITRFFRKATPAEIKAAPKDPGTPPFAMQYLGQKFFVCP